MKVEIRGGCSLCVDFWILIYVVYVRKYCETNISLDYVEFTRF